MTRLNFINIEEYFRWLASFGFEPVTKHGKKDRIYESRPRIGATITEIDVVLILWLDVLIRRRRLLRTGRCCQVWRTGQAHAQQTVGASFMALVGRPPGRVGGLVVCISSIRPETYQMERTLLKRRLS